MKRKIKDYAIIFAVVVGYFLPLVLVALGFAFSWTIAIVAGIVCEIGVFFIFGVFLLTILKFQDELNMYKDLYNDLVKKNKEDSK
nr:MAG TPA: Positive regulator of sigma(E), RseC/MucC [Caudoviricetes sp.]